MFKEMLFNVYSETIKILNRVESIETVNPESIIDGQSPKKIKYSRSDSQKNNALPASSTTNDIGRNDRVVIEKNGQTQEIKWKKAQNLIQNEGWKVIEKKPADA